MAFVGLAAPELVVGAVEVVQGPKHSKTLREPQMRSTRGNLHTEIKTTCTLKFHSHSILFGVQQGEVG